MQAELLIAERPTEDTARADGYRSAGPDFGEMVDALAFMETYTEAEDLREIADYLKLGPTGREMQEITGLSASSLSEILKGHTEESRLRRHTAVVAALVRSLRERRARATGSPDRGVSAAGWLHSAIIRTSRGPKKPIEIFSDPDFALEALVATRASL